MQINNDNWNDLYLARMSLVHFFCRYNSLLTKKYVFKLFFSVSICVYQTKTLCINAFRINYQIIMIRSFPFSAECSRLEVNHFVICGNWNKSLRRNFFFFFVSTWALSSLLFYSIYRMNKWKNKYSHKRTWDAFIHKIFRFAFFFLLIYDFVLCCAQNGTI